MKVGSKGKGGEIKWVDESELQVAKDFEAYKTETAKTIADLQESLTSVTKQLEIIKLENSQVIKGLISR